MRLGELDLKCAEQSVMIANDARTLLERITATLNTVKPEDVEQLSKAVSEACQGCGTPSAAAGWELWHHSLLLIATHLRRRLVALTANGDTGPIREKQAFLVEDIRQLAERHAADPAAQRLASAAALLLDKMDLKPLIDELAAVPLPTIYLKARDDGFRLKQPQEELPTAPEPSVIRVVGQLDGQPLVGPQIIRPRIVYSLSFELRGMYWPSDAHEMRLDLVTTCPPELYHTTSFALSKPTSLERYEGKLDGQLSFVQAQSSLSPSPLTFAIRAAFRCPDSWKPTPVIGCKEMQFRVTDEASVPIFSGFRTIDQHVAQLVQKLVGDCPQVISELPTLLPMLTALSALLGTYAQGGVLKGATSMDEAQFQRDVLRDLRMKLGEDVEEHRHQAGGITDIRYRGVVAELKVENSDGRRSAIAKKFAAQATQYQGAEGRQVGIVLVLDQTEKVLPPGDCRNDVLLVEVPTHGGPDTSKCHPSKVFVFVVNGNLKSPSEYSR